MADIIQRFITLLSSNACTVGASAVQVSGGPQANWPLTAVGAAFYPNYHRAALRITNTHASQNLFVGSTASVTNAAGGGWIYELTPGQSTPPQFERISGSIPVWVVGSGAGTVFTVEEYQ